MISDWHDTRGISMSDVLKIFNIRLQPELHAALTNMAKEQKRSLHNMVIVILASAVERWEKERQSGAA